MKKNFEFDFIQKSNNNTLFDYPNNNSPINLQNSNYLEKWSKLESKLQKNRIDNYFSNDSISSLNLCSLKSMEWDDLNMIQTKNNYDAPLNDKYLNEHNYVNIQRLQQLIHPIDDEFDIFIQNKIENLEKLKCAHESKNVFRNNKKNNNIKNNINIINIINNNIKKKINNNIQNNLKLNKEQKVEKSIIKDKNEAIFTFNKNDNDNNDDFDRIKTKSFLADYTYNDNVTDNSILYTNKKDDNDLGFRNKIRLNKILSRIKNDKKETEIINKPNKFKLFDNSDENSNLNKIQKRYYEQLREEDKQKDNDYTKDYFSTILYELNQK